MNNLIHINNIPNDLENISQIRCIDEPQLAECLSIGISTIRQWRTNGGGPPFVKISRRCVRYRIDDVHEWMNKKLRENTLEDGQ